LVSDEEEIRSGCSWPWWRRALTGLSTLALALSAYLGWHFIVGEPVIGCGDGSSCDEMLSGRWSSIGGVVPVSGLAAGVYLAMVVASLFVGPKTEAPVRKLAWRATAVLVGAAAGSAVWFAIVQKWIIGSFCPYCMATHVIGLLLATLVIWQAPRQFDNESNDILPQPVIGRLSAIGLALIGVVFAGILAVSQLAFTPPTIYRAGDLQRNLLGVDPHAAPLVGSPEAPYVVTLLFDYKCSHCQRMHFMLDEAVRRYAGKLAIALCPTPLNRQCNPYIPHDVSEFADSCELAKVGLAVWVAQREAFPAFERWMFSLESGDRWQPRSLDAARAKAVELVGQEKFDTARNDPWIDRYMQTSIQIYRGTSGGAIPKLVFGSRWVVPELQDAGDLVTVLHNSLGVPRP
jgi:uncharacterized membrane protein